MDYSDTHYYLGMQIVLQDGFTVIDMTHFLEKLLATCVETDIVEYNCPARKTLFWVDEKAIQQKYVIFDQDSST